MDKYICEIAKQPILKFNEVFSDIDNLLVHNS